MVPGAFGVFVRRVTLIWDGAPHFDYILAGMD